MGALLHTFTKLVTRKEMLLNNDLLNFRSNKYAIERVFTCFLFKCLGFLGQVNLH